MTIGWINLGCFAPNGQQRWLICHPVVNLSERRSLHFPATVRLFHQPVLQYHLSGQFFYWCNLLTSLFNPLTQHHGKSHIYSEARRYVPWDNLFDYDKTLCSFGALIFITQIIVFFAQVLNFTFTVIKHKFNKILNCFPYFTTEKLKICLPP